jgi:ankyrin repeat protein
MYAAEFGRLGLVKLLLDRGADVNMKNRWGLTPLLYAVTAPHPDPQVVQALLDGGADPHVRDAKADSALALAKRAVQVEIVKMLEKAGAVE